MAFIVLIVVAGACGTLMLRPLPLAGMEGIALRLIAGLCVCAVFLLTLGSLSLAVAQILMFVLAGACIIFEFRRLSRGRDDGEPWYIREEDSDRVETGCMAVVGVANGLAAINALAPNTSWDAGVAHLALPSDYCRDGVIHLLEGNVYSAYPHLLHALYTYVYCQSGELGVGIINWVFGPLACIALYMLGKRVHSKRVGLVAAAMFSTAPIFFNQSGTVSLDVPFVALSVAALACFVAWRDDKNLSWLVTSAFFAGSSCGIRHTGYLVCAFLLVGTLLISKERRTQATMVFAAVATLASAPWLLRSFVVVGNPVYPFLSGFFASNQLPDVQTTALGTHESIQGTGLLEFLMFAWDIVMRPYMFDGWSVSPGPFVLLLGVPGLIVGGVRARALGAYSIAGGICFFFFQRFARYLLPFFAPMYVVAAIAAEHLKQFRRPIEFMLFFGFAYGLLMGTAMVHFKLPVAMGLQLRTHYLQDRVERYEAFQWVNQNLPAASTIMTFDPRSYFIDGPTFQNFEILRTIKDLSLEDQAVWLKGKGIDYIFYPVSYIDESPSYSVYGFKQQLATWREDPIHFQLVKTLTLARARTQGTETVEIYKVLSAVVGAEENRDVGR